MTQKQEEYKIPTNVWLDNKLVKNIDGIFNKRRGVDLIPSIYNGKEGVCLISMSADDIKKILGACQRGVTINTTGTIQAIIKDTEILVPVISVEGV